MTFNAEEQSLMNGGDGKSKSAEPTKGKTKAKTQSKSDRHSSTSETANQMATQDKATLANRTKQQLSGLQQSLDKLSNDRTNAVEQVSDTLAYLYSPATFQSDVMTRTAEKLGLKDGKSEPETITLDSDCFSTFADAIEYPAMAANGSCGGALPASY